MPREKGPFKVPKRVNDNAFKIDLSGGFRVSTTFNVIDLSPYEDNDNLINLRSNLGKKREGDRGPSWTNF